MTILRWFFLTISLLFAFLAALLLFDNDPGSKTLARILDLTSYQSPLKKSFEQEWQNLAQKNKLPNELKKVKMLKFPNRILSEQEKEAIALLTKKIAPQKDGSLIAETELFEENSEVKKNQKLLIIQISIFDSKTSNKIDEFAVTLTLPQSK